MEQTEDYSGRNFTYIEDRMLAISGLASATQLLTGGQYVAGLWLQELPAALLWKSFQSYMVRNDKFYFPTWSWISVIGSVTWPLDDVHVTDADGLVKDAEYIRLTHPHPSPFCAEIIDVQTYPAGLDPFGNLASGYLRLRGLMRKYSINPHN